MTPFRAARHAFCNRRKFETGEGGCAAICMSMLGSSRPNCQYQMHIHSELVTVAQRIAVEECIRIADHFAENAASEGMSEEVVMARAYTATDIAAAMHVFLDTIPVATA